MKEHVFICYAREDKKFVLKLAMSLKQAGAPVWLDQWDIPAGANWNKSIENAIYDCAKFLIVLSPAAVESEDVEGEWLTALDEKKTIIPLIYRPCRIPPRLRALQYIDFSSCNPEDTAALEPLIRDLGVEQQTNQDSEEHPDQFDTEYSSSSPIPPIGLSIETATPDPPYWTLPHGEPRWITIPAGKFWMGSNENDSDAYDDEKPLHEVLVSEFRIAPTSVTNEQYQLYVKHEFSQKEGLPPPA